MQTEPHPGVGHSFRARLVRRCLGVATSLPPSAMRRLKPGLAAAVHAVPAWRGRVRESMRAALGDREDLDVRVRRYFDHLAEMVTNAAILYREGKQPEWFRERWYYDPQAEEIYTRCLEAGNGVLLAGAHLFGSEQMAGTITHRVPVAVLARRSPDPGYEAIKQRWYDALGVRVIHRPSRARGLASYAEFAGAMKVLRENWIVALTPDLIQRRGTGVEVRLFGRRLDLPRGPWFLAHRTGSPLVPSFMHEEDRRYRLWCHPPQEVPRDVSRDEAMAWMAQEWTGHLEEFLREHPEMWQFWLDKRWSRWLRARRRGAGDGDD